MQMAQRKRQHEREEASEQEGEDEEYSEEEEEEYFEEGEEEERSFYPEEEASESDDSRDWKRRSRYKRESFRRPRQARKAKRQPLAASPRRSESREPSAKRHQPLAVRKPKAVLRPQPPKYPPPPPPPPPPPYTPGFWFGHTHRMDITGPAVAGRWIHAKNQVWQKGEWSRSLPKLFRAGGHQSRFRQQAWDEDMERCLEINGLLKHHEFEHRRWIPEWGPKQPPEPAVGGSENWQVIMEPAPAADDPFFGQFQLQRQAGWRHAPAVGGCGQPSTTIVREAAGQPMSTAYEARDVYVVNLPELFLHFLHTRYAGDIYHEWLCAEIIIGRKPPRGQSGKGKGKGKGKGGEKGKCKTKTWRGQSQEERQEETQDTP